MNFFIDLLLYHRKLRCLVVIELKIGKFEPSDMGQLQFYLTALNEQEKGEKLNDKFHRNWLESSKLRYGNALLKWSKFLNKKFEE